VCSDCAPWLASGLHHKLGVGQVVLQDKRVDRDDDDVLASVHDQGSLLDVPQQGVSVLRGRGAPFADRVQLSACRLNGHRRVAISRPKLQSFEIASARGLAAFARSKE
jgi:hypothetical protein